MDNARTCPQCRQRLAIDSFEVRGNAGFRFKKCNACRKENCKFVCRHAYNANCDFATNNAEEAERHIQSELMIENVMAGRRGWTGIFPEKI